MPGAHDRTAYCHELDRADAEVGLVAGVARLDALGDEAGEGAEHLAAVALAGPAADLEADPADDVELGIRAALRDRRPVDGEEDFAADAVLERLRRTASR